MTHRKRKHLTMATAGIAALALGLSACGGGGDAEAGGDPEGNLEDTYVVASDTSFVPFAFDEDGEYVGFDMDIINELAERVGFEIQLETTNFDGIIPGLQTGTFDIVCAQHCGIHHYKMRGKLIVMEPDAYRAWLDEASALAARAFDAEDKAAQWGWDWDKQDR